MVQVAQILERRTTEASAIELVRKRLKEHLRGKDGIIEFALAAFLAKGHLLLEGPPGTGKTSLAKAMASAFGGEFRRVQMTSDLLPSDIVGILRLRAGGADFEFRKGPIFSHFLLADELNRTSPKTQGALLEAMAEGTVTVDGTSYPLPDPFFVVATQNPLEFHGVYPFAESQLDRFMLRLSLSSPEKKDEMEIYQASAETSSDNQKAAEHERPLLTLEETRALRDTASAIYIEQSVLEYVGDLVRATRTHSSVAYGVSVRGGLQFIAAAKALAYVRGKDFVSPKEVNDLAIPVLSHRLCYSGGDPDTQQRSNTVREILERVQPPK